MKMDDIAHTKSNDGMLKNAAPQAEEDVVNPGPSTSRVTDERDGLEGVHEEGGRRPRKSKKKSYSHAHYKVYKRRWLGLAQLVLLNIVVSWDVGFLFSYFYVWTADTHVNLERDVLELTLHSG